MNMRELAFYKKKVKKKRQRWKDVLLLFFPQNVNHIMEKDDKDARACVWSGCEYNMNVYIKLAFSLEFMHTY